MNIFEVFAKISLNKKEFDNGVKDAEGKMSKLGGALKTGLAAVGGVATATIGAVGTAVVSLAKQSVNAYADTEQLVGGVGKLFGTSGQTVEEYAKSVGKSVEEVKAKYDEMNAAESEVLENAKNAYKTAGLSANEYIETVTSFSASLISSVGGDTLKAAKMADMAISDMSDNANTYGSSMESIQNAYNGFAKGQFNMLDNLKLGYGGTASEAARLIEDAEKLDKSFKAQRDSSGDLTMSYADMVDAIHIVQNNMKITGTTSREAASTISGSIAMTKASWTNLVAGLADSNADIDSLVNNFVDSVSKMAENMLPAFTNAVNGVANMIENIAPKIVEFVPSVIKDSLPSLLNAVVSVVDSIVQALPELITSITTMITENFLPSILKMMPSILSAGIKIIVALARGISQSLPELIPMAVQIITDLIDELVKNIPMLITSAIAIIKGLADGIIAALPVLMEALPEIINTIVNVLTMELPNLLNQGMTLLMEIMNGIIEALPSLAENLPLIIDAIVNFFTENLPTILEMGVQLLISLIEGIVNNLPTLMTAIMQVIGSIMTSIISNLPKIITMGLRILLSLINGIVKAIPQLIAYVPTIIKTIVDNLTARLSMIKDVGSNLIKGLWNGIKDTVGWLIGKVKEIGSNILGAIKGVFGIHSPSKKTAYFGRMLAEGLGIGWEQEIDKVKDDITDSLPDFDTSATFSTSAMSNIASGNQYSFNDVLAMLREALEGVSVVMDGQKMGRFVTKTITKAVAV